MLLIQTPARSIYLDPKRVAAIDVSLPRQDSQAGGRWSSRVEIYLEGGGIVTLWIGGADPDYVLERANEIVGLVFPIRDMTSVIVD